jgi:hypothetical protein
MEDAVSDEEKNGDEDVAGTIQLCVDKLCWYDCIDLPPSGRRVLLVMLVRSYLLTSLHM